MGSWVAFQMALVTVGVCWRLWANVLPIWRRGRAEDRDSFWRDGVWRGVSRVRGRELGLGAYSEEW